MRWPVLIFLFLTMGINFADKSIIGYASESIMNEFGLTYTEWGLVGSSFFWLFSVSGVFVAAWSDKWGTKKVIALMLIGWSILQFGAFAISGLSMLIVYRVVLGLTEGPFTPTAISHISKWFKPGSRGMAISVLNAGGMLGALATAPLLVIMIEKLGWRMSFASLGFLSVIFLIVWLALPETKRLTYSKKGSDVNVAPSKLKWSEFSIILKSPTCLFTLLAAFSASWMTMWITLWMPNYLTKVVEMKPMNMGYTASIVGIGSVFISVLLSTYSDRLFNKSQNFRLSRIYFAGAALVIAGISLASTTIIHSAAWVTIAILITKGFSYTIMAISPQVLMQLMPERAGLMTSLSTSFMNIAGMVGPVITGALVQSAGGNITLGFNYSILLTAGFLFIFGMLFSLFARPENGKKGDKDPLAA
ncbi:MFS transporter [Bacillus sp. 1P06AnD]|uniref:MFS transporter n=1 Tax=Bacillus sp. 1P06AnD TaxID=3132208 RepID=UPI0039A29257